jgi:hypothetical protein
VKSHKFLNLLFNLAVSLLIGSIAGTYFMVDPLKIAVGFFAVMSLGRIVILFIRKVLSIELDRNVHLIMAVQTEVWENAIAENLFKEYSWIKRAKDRTSFVINDKVVHIPQAGLKPNASKNREVFPLPVVKRNDSDITYAIDEITTDATYIPEADKIELSYDKITSIVKDHFGVIGERTALDVLDRWYPSLASHFVRTTGADTAVYLEGQTGTRKKFVIADVESAKSLMNTQTKKETGNRALILSEKMYEQLKSDTKATSLDTQNSVGAVWTNGDLVKICGFDIIRTDVTGRFDNTATPIKKDYTLALKGTYAATDNDVALLVDFSFVHVAEGSVKFFGNKDDATYQGDIYSAYKRIGARKERADEVGLIAIIQTP